MDGDATTGLPLFTSGREVSGLLNHPAFEDVRRSVVVRFEKFHAENPHIFELVVKFAKQLKARGRTRYGMKSIAERVRWEMAVETDGDDFKINNNYMSCYARLLILKYPEFRSMFKTRKTPGYSDK